MKQSPSSGVVMKQDTTTVEIRDNAYGTIPIFWWDGTIPVSWWGWPDEAVLADFVEQNARAEQDARVEQANQPVKEDSAYAALYFVS